MKRIGIRLPALAATAIWLLALLTGCGNETGSGGVPATVDTTPAVLRTPAPAAGTEAPETPEPTEAPAPVAAASAYDWWNGKWYGWWVVYLTEGNYAGMEDTACDVYAQISVDGDEGSIELFEIEDPEKPLAYADVSFGDGTTAHGAMISENGLFLDSGEIGHADWIVDPGASIVSEYEDMICIDGEYQDPTAPGSSFTYYIFLRPWGMLWDDVEQFVPDTAPYYDMMPLDYSSWYLPQLEESAAPAPAAPSTAPSAAPSTAPSTSDSLSAVFDVHGLYSVRYDPSKFRPAEPDEFPDLVSTQRERSNLYITGMDKEFAQEKIKSLESQDGVVIETFVIAGCTATLYRYNDWLGPQCELVIPLNEQLKNTWGSYDAIYIYASGDEEDDVYNADILAVMQSVELSAG